VISQHDEGSINHGSITLNGVSAQLYRKTQLTKILRHSLNDACVGQAARFATGPSGCGNPTLLILFLAFKTGPTANVFDGNASTN